ncbi:hypothetical protein AQUCO_07200172v1 [Aquilegia coerulea]|uniref:SGNH hydrolase-type esterase domain-containing protein n=1 Tax=Aquilegia coerulea TaxID=218851 RepID=A0A2G5CAM7_AQUCA|nr:hypothetical protein AQUCO_07200172v1 [Aquilegia coerulea]
MEIQMKQLSFLHYFFFFFALIITGNQLVQGSSNHHHHHSHHHHHRNLQQHHGNRIGVSKLFVFGDSYADTGNNRRSAGSWSMPYGITFPASYLRIKSPIPYKWRKIGKEALRYGMNFAYGGTGVFNTHVPEPNMTTQIDFFQTLIQEGAYTKHDLSSSIALVSIAGNDYGTYTGNNGTDEGLPAFITSVTNQLVLDVKRIYDLGVRKVAVTALQPLGCLPRSTVVSSFQNCNGTQNTAVNFHNQLLQDAVVKLNNSTKDSAFVILDLYNAFMSVFNSQKDKAGSLKFQNPLTPCCLGINNQYSCGSVDEHGVKKYGICNDPKSTFFWDTVHPTQQGWLAVYSALRGSLDQLYH